MATRRSPRTKEPQEIVRFAIEHLRVRTFVCTRQVFDTGYTLPERTVPDYNFIYVTRGRVVWVVDGYEYPLSPGSLVLVPPGVIHHGFSETKRMGLVSVHVLVDLPGGMDVFALLQPPRALKVRAGCALDRYLRGAMAEYDRDDQAEALSVQRHWADLIVREFLRQCAAEKKLNVKPLDPLIAAVLDSFRKDLAAPVELTSLAKQCGYSPQHLNRVFQRTLGVTPLQCLTTMRMEQAAAWLRDGAWSVKSIAEKCGYADPYHFSRQFHQHWDRSPSDYRKAAEFPA